MALTQLLVRFAVVMAARLVDVHRLLTAWTWSVAADSPPRAGKPIGPTDRTRAFLVQLRARASAEPPLASL